MHYVLKIISFDNYLVVEYRTRTNEEIYQLFQKPNLKAFIS